jgi:hypothetical protein
MTTVINGVNYDILDVIRQLQQVDDPEEGIRLATRLIDQARDELLVELAALRRSFAVRARTALMDQGMSATEANRVLAARVETSPQSVGRMVTEASQYGSK